MELISDAENDDTNDQKEGASHKMINSLKENMDDSCKNNRSYKTDKKRRSVCPLEMSARLVARERQRSNNSTSEERDDKVETLGKASEACLCLEEEDQTDTFTLRRSVETPKFSHYSNETNPNTHARSGAISLNTKPNISIRRDPNILQKRTEAEESMLCGINGSAVSKIPNNSLSLHRRSAGLAMSHREDAQKCKHAITDRNTLSTKGKAMTHTSATASAQSKSKSLSRSTSPAPIGEQQSQQVNSEDPSRKDGKSIRPQKVCLKKNQQLLKNENNVLKSPHANIQFSKSKLEQGKKEKEENKDVTCRTDSLVTRCDPIISDTSSQNCSLREDEEPQLQSPANASSSSESDTHVADPKHHPKKSTTRVEQLTRNRSKSLKRPAKFIRQAKFVEQFENHGNSYNITSLAKVHERGFSRRDVKPKPIATVHKDDSELDATFLNPTMGGSVSTQLQISRDRNGVSSVKGNSSSNTVNCDVSINKFNIKAKTGNEFSHVSADENKQNKKATAKLNTKTYKSMSNQPSPYKNISEFEHRKLTASTKPKQRADTRENKICDWKKADDSYKEENKTDIVSSKTESQLFKISDSEGLSSKLIGLDELMQSVSTERLFCPCSAKDIINLSQTGRSGTDVTQTNSLPAIYFCWQKCPYQQSKESLTQPDLQQVVSLEQGLSVFKQMMTAATSESTPYSREYTLNKLIPKEVKSWNSYRETNKNEQFMVAGTCFQLKPKYKTKYNERRLSSDGTSGSTLNGLFSGDRIYLSQENGHKMLLGKNNDSYHLHSTLDDTVWGSSDLQAAMDITRAVKNSIQRHLNMGSLWSLVSHGIVALFMHRLERPSITYSVLEGDFKDNNRTSVLEGDLKDNNGTSVLVGDFKDTIGTNVDEINTFSFTGYKLEESQPQRMCNDAVVLLQHASPSIDHWPVSYEQATVEETKSCTKYAKLNSERKRTPHLNTSPKGNGVSPGTNSSKKSKSVLPEKKQDHDIDNEFVQLNLESSTVDSLSHCKQDCMSPLSFQMGIPEHPLHIQPNVANRFISPNLADNNSHLDKSGKSVVASEQLRVNNTGTNNSHQIHSDTLTLKSRHFEKIGRNELNNIPFSPHMYKSLEGPQIDSGCDVVFAQQRDFGYTTYESNELEFVVPSEDSPDPELEDNTNSDLKVRLPGYVATNLRQFPHLVWTWRYGQSMLDNEGQQGLVSEFHTCNESLGLNDQTLRLYEAEETIYNSHEDDSVRLIQCKSYPCTNEKDASEPDPSVKDVNCFVSTKSPLGECYHNLVTETCDTALVNINPAANVLSERPYLSDQAKASLQPSCEQDSGEASLGSLEHHEHFPAGTEIPGTIYNTVKKICDTIVPLSGSPSLRGKCEEKVFTSIDVNDDSEGSAASPGITKQSLQLFSIENIIRAALALKEASTLPMSYLYSSHTTSACSYLLSVGCCRPLSATFSNLIFAQQLARYTHRRMLDRYGSSVDDRALNTTNGNLVENHVCTEETCEKHVNNSLDTGNTDTDIDNRVCNGSETSDISDHSSQVRYERQTQPETTGNLSFPKRSNFSETANSDADERITSSRVSSKTVQPGRIFSHASSSSSQKERNKTMSTELHIPRITDLLVPNACRSDEGEESGIFSYYSLSSPPVTQNTDMDNPDSSSESFKSGFTQN